MFYLSFSAQIHHLLLLLVYLFLLNMDHLIRCFQPDHVLSINLDQAQLLIELLLLC